jgi:hypothetical protein
MLTMRTTGCLTTVEGYGANREAARIPPRALVLDDLFDSRQAPGL